MIGMRVGNESVCVWTRACVSVCGHIYMCVCGQMYVREREGERESKRLYCCNVTSEIERRGQKYCHECQNL